MKVTLATCARLPDGPDGDADLPDLLAGHGVTAHWQVWDDDAPVHTDLVVLRSTWDYTWQLDRFLDWCATVPRLANPLPVVRWNTDKSYLLDLAEAGIAVPPTRLVAPGEPLAWPGGEVVLKPSVGAGARGFARCADRDAAQAHLDALHRRGATVLVQPYLPSVDREGEVAQVFLGGAYSHAFAKAVPDAEPIDDTGRRLSEISPLPAPPPGFRQLAEDALDAAAALTCTSRADLLYARVDLVRGDDGAPLVLELELVEPHLAFGHADPGALSRFAAAISASAGTRPRS